jgi:hypothetical protein
MAHNLPRYARCAQNLSKDHSNSEMTCNDANIYQQQHWSNHLKMFSWAFDSAIETWKLRGIFSHLHQFVKTCWVEMMATEKENVSDLCFQAVIYFQFLVWVNSEKKSFWAVFVREKSGKSFFFVSWGQILFTRVCGRIFSSFVKRLWLTPNPSPISDVDRMFKLNVYESLFNEYLES